MVQLSDIHTYELATSIMHRLLLAAKRWIDEQWLVKLNACEAVHSHSRIFYFFLVTCSRVCVDKARTATEAKDLELHRPLGGNLVVASLYLMKRSQILNQRE